MQFEKSFCFEAKRLLLKELRREQEQTDMSIHVTITNEDMRFDISWPLFDFDVHTITSVLVNLLKEKGWGQNFHYGTHIYADYSLCCMSSFELLTITSKVGVLTTKEL